jgi:hypothetical protein
MSDKPEIKVGQRWVTRYGDVVRVLATDGRVNGYPVIVEDESGKIDVVTIKGKAIDGRLVEGGDLLHLAPFTVKREVALYANGEQTTVGLAGHEGGILWRAISEPLTIEFTLLPGECAE